MKRKWNSPSASLLNRKIFKHWETPTFLTVIKSNCELSRDALIYYINHAWFPNLRDVPSNLVDSDILDLVVEKHPLDLMHLPLAEIDHDLAYSAVRTVLDTCQTSKKYASSWYDRIFMEIPNKLKDADLCQEAHSCNPILAFFMPEEHTNYQMFLDLSNGRCDQCDSVYNSLERVPNKFRTLELCRNYVTKISGLNIKHVPSHLQTQGLCNLAFKQNSNAIHDYIPEEFITYEMCLQAATLKDQVSCSELPRYIPRKYQTKEFCEIYHQAIINNSYLRTREHKCFCAECILANPMSYTIPNPEIPKDSKLRCSRWQCFQLKLPNQEICHDCMCQYQDCKDTKLVLRDYCSWHLCISCHRQPRADITSCQSCINKRDN